MDIPNFVHRIQSGFTTTSYAVTPDLPITLRLVPLADDVLGVHKITQPKILTHRIVRSPRPINLAATEVAHHDVSESQAWEAFYPKGSINPSGTLKGGFGFYLSGPDSFRGALRNATEVVMGYSVLFEKGW